MVSRSAVVLACPAILLCASAAQALPAWEDRPGTVVNTLGLPDGSRVFLDAVMVDRVMGPWIFVRDPWSGQPLLAVYGYAPVERWQSLDIAGTKTATAGGSVLVAGSISAYVDSKGGVMPPMPKTRLPWEWPFMQALPVSSAAMTASVPSPPDPTPLENTTSYSPTAPEGSVAAAKLAEDETPVTLSGKVVTAVFDGDANTSPFFYIVDAPGENQAPVSPVGIRVDCASILDLDLVPGRIVTVSGTLVASSLTDPECHIDSTSITYGLTASYPATVFMPARSTAGAEYGSQWALQGNASTAGVGLNAVGTRVKVSGWVTWTDVQDGHIVYYLGDGSNFSRKCIDNSKTYTRKGLKVILWDSAVMPKIEEAGDDLREPYVSVAGVLGADFSDDTPGVAMPVVRASLATKPDVIYVDCSTGTTGTPDGSSWSAAFSTVAAGIATANVGDEVWVADGTYYEWITIPNGVSLYGGFSGVSTEVSKAQRDWSTNLTILDGSSQGTVVTMATPASPESTVTPRVDGFVIQNGSAMVPGGGIAFEAAEQSGRISNAIVNNTIRYNCSTIGGCAISCNGGFPVIYGNHIHDNGDTLSMGAGGGLSFGPVTRVGQIVNTPYIFLAHNLIEDNMTQDAGGVLCYGTMGLIWANTIDGNRASLFGAGIYADPTSRVDVIDNVISNNGVQPPTAPEALEGGGLYVERAPNGTNVPFARIEGNLFDGNCATEVGGAISIRSCSDTVVVNNIFRGNKAGNGGAIYTQYTPVIVNNTFVDNQAGSTATPGIGGAVAADSQYACPLLVNNVFCGNLAINSLGTGNSVACRQFGNAIVRYCWAYSDVTGSDTLPYHYILGGSSMIGTECSVYYLSLGSIFVNELSHDYHLASPGPLYTPIGQGHDPVSGDPVYSAIPSRDYDRLPRSVSTDMGAYEVQP